MKKIVVILLLVMLYCGIFTVAISAEEEIYKEYVNVDVGTFEENPYSQEIVPFSIEHEREYRDGWFSDAPNGTAKFKFKTESGDKRLNIYFNNKSETTVTVTLFKSGGWSNWLEVGQMVVYGGSSDYFQVNSDISGAKYKVEISNSTGDKILGRLRVRSYSNFN